MIAAALAGHHLKTTVHEGRGGTCAAEMDECGEILLLLRACRCVWRAGKNCRDIVVQVHGRELDGMARDRARVYRTARPHCLAGAGFIPRLETLYRYAGRSAPYRLCCRRRGTQQQGQASK